MDLTRRQEQFVRNLLDLYHEAEGPLHYSVLAERLGVSRFTAYDMLRLLEEKGLVTSSYQLAADKSGPGRSEVVFAPTERARRLLDQLAGDVEAGDWEALKERVLARIQGEGTHDRELAMEVLARVPPEEPEVIRYCVEVMTVIALRLERPAGRELLRDFLPHLLPEDDAGCRPNLCLLGGFALGALAGARRAEQEWELELLEHARQYQALVLDMPPERCRRLADRLAAVFASLP